ncbi:sporulation histidine kinase inhibitor Sda [Bacillus sp. JJ1562]
MPNDLLVYAYHKAVKLRLDRFFIKMLLDEISRRKTVAKIPLKK